LIRVEGWDRAEVETVVIKTVVVSDARAEDVVISVKQAGILAKTLFTKE
jgi:hypothetical protein